MLLQNQGGLRINVRGHLLISEQAMETSRLDESGFLFRDDVVIPPGAYVILISGEGESKWAKTKDQQLVYYAYLGRLTPFWSALSGALHVLAPQHSYSERREALMLR